MSSSALHDELTSTVLSAIESLPQTRKANLLLEQALALLEAGRYGDEAERYLDVFLRTPGLPQDAVARALVARGKARKEAGQRLLVKSEQDFQLAAKIDPSIKDIPVHIRRDRLISTSNVPVLRRVPAEIWENIAEFVPRYFLRTWLFVSSFYRDIAARVIFRTVDLYFGEDQEGQHRGLDILDRVKADPVFARYIKTLRLHWAHEEGELLDLICRLFRIALPGFIALKEFEWIGYPELQADMVEAVLSTHPHLDKLGLIGWHFDAVGVSRFKHLRKFTLRAEDDDGFADMGEVRTLLDNNASTLRHLVLGAYLKRTHSWDSAFQSTTIQNLTHLDLFDTRISHVVLARIAHAHRLQSLTLHGTFEQPGAASVVFGSDHIIDGQHMFLPHLEAFRFVLVGHDDNLALFQSVMQFLRGRKGLRRLDLGGCSWELMLGVLPELTGLRVLRVRIANLTSKSVEGLVQSIPRDMVAIHLSAIVWDTPLHLFAQSFRRFTFLSILHLHGSHVRRPQHNLMSEREYHIQSDIWNSGARHVAITLPSLHFIGWHGEHYVVVRCPGDVELKELPVRRRLDCGKGVNLGTDDAAWMERKDVPMDYEMSGIEV